MSRRALLWGVFALWLLAIVVSALYWTAEPTGDGFVRGLNRLTGFLGAQLVAAMLALVAWLVSAPFPKRSPERWFGRIPGWWAVGLLLLILGSIAVVFLYDPGLPDPVPELPTTEAPDAVPTE